MPGSKQQSRSLHQAWEGNQSVEAELAEMPRASLPPGYPEDLARGTRPEDGNLGAKGMPIKNREAPFTLKGRR